MIEVDKIDREILRLLQKDGRLTNAELASKINLSPAASWKRLKKLEEGVIGGYHATVKREALGLKLFAFVHVMLDVDSQEAMDRFEDAVLRLPNVLACHNVSGRYCYLLQVVVSDMDEYHEFSTKHLRVIGNIREMHTSFSLKQVKLSHVIPV
ncbi:AsnC family transcriptional regulator [Burkholderia lata]|uniref:AsnC family transcriptional regulator n=1 Tax=Burkholderia lata (strain ATCC 17760 / DSM 23089 / LMG 22485 / NCIMB 9086 / R18194 / 383) TaxID=482957 RepID=A0A6P2V785_BURL3|nr:Lrp/AsnC family transcriptional regulator [Burkholderia lata]VWC76239.1 AsnC family transcriptional regulator [Burkholderia lata]